MKTILTISFSLFMISQFFGGVICADEKKSKFNEKYVLAHLNSNTERGLSRGLMHARAFNTFEINEKLVLILDSDIELFSNGDVIQSHPWQDALSILTWRFPEYTNNPKDRSVSAEKAASFKKWWALNKHNIIYHDDNTHSYRETNNKPNKTLHTNP